jgi:hypothetical protein
VITDDEVMRLFERADPARVDDDASVIDAAGDLDAVRTRSNNVPIIETTPTPAEPTSRHRRPFIIAAAAAAAAAVVLIVIGAVALATRDDDTTQPATDQTPVATEPAQNLVNASPAEVAQGFVEAYGGFDADRAFSYLADDADIAGLIDGFTTEEVRGTRDELRLVIALLEAQHYQQTHVSCDELSSSATDDVSFRCTFDIQSLGSDQLGLGPFSGNFIDLTTRPLYRDSVGNRWGPQIVRATYHFDDQRFSDQVWVPFEDWVLANHSQDAVTMYSTRLPDGQEGVRLTEEAIPLWEQLTREYVTDKTTQG